MTGLRNNQVPVRTWCDYCRDEITFEEIHDGPDGEKLCRQCAENLEGQEPQ